MDLKRLLRFVELSQDMLCVIDAAGRLQFVNPAFSQILGMDKGESNQYAFKDLLHPEDVPITKKKLVCLESGVESVQFENRIRHKMGHYVSIDWEFWVEVEDGNAYGIGRNISYQKQLESSNQMLERAIGAIGTGMFIIDARTMEHPIIYVNASFEAITGYALEEIWGKKIDFLCLETQNQADWIYMQNLLRIGQNAHLLVKSKHKDGSELFLELHIAPELNKMGKASHFIGSIHNITEQILTQQELKTSKQNLENRLETLQQFSNIISHKLRAPLANILGLSQLIRDDIYDSGELPQLVRIINEECTRMDRVVQDISNTLNSYGLNRQNQQKVIVSQIVQKLESSFFYLLEESQIRIQSDFSSWNELSTSSEILSRCLGIIINYGINWNRNFQEKQIHIFTSLHQDCQCLNLILSGNMLEIGLKRSGTIASPSSHSARIYPREGQTDFHVLRQLASAMNCQFEVKYDEGAGSSIQFYFIWKDDRFPDFKKELESGGNSLVEMW